jgi:hypothetical protein
MPHDPARVAGTVAWVSKAKEDLRAAEFELTANPPLTADIESYLPNVQQNDFRKVYRAKAPRAQRKMICHFDRREKSFLDPSHSLGMTALGPSPWRLCVPSTLLRTCFAGVIFFPIPYSKIKPKILNIVA